MKIKLPILILTIILLTSMVKSPVSLPSIYFHENSTTFVKRPKLKEVKSSKEVLKTIYKIMRDNPHITNLEISGYCDFLEKDTLLGIQRAKKVMNHLVGKGIDSSRFSLKGYYNERLLITPKDFERLTNEKEIQLAHMLNRRVNFQVLEINNDKK